MPLVEIFAAIHLVFVDENPYFEPKMVSVQMMQRKETTSPIELPMLLDDDLHIDEDWTLILWQRMKATQSYSSCMISDFTYILVDFYPKEAMEFTATAPVLSEK